MDISMISVRKMADKVQAPLQSGSAESLDAPGKKRGFFMALEIWGFHIYQWKSYEVYYSILQYVCFFPVIFICKYAQEEKSIANQTIRGYLTGNPRGAQRSTIPLDREVMEPVMDQGAGVFSGCAKF